MSDYDIELPGKVFVRIERSERKRGVTTGPKTDYVVKVPDKPETVVPSLSGLFMYLKGYYPDSADVEEARRIMNRFLKNKDEDDLQHGNVGSDNDSELAMSPSPAKRQNTGKLGASAGTAVPSTPQRTNAAAGVCGSGRSKLNMLLDQLAAQRQPSGQPSVGDVLGSMAGGAAVPSAATAAASAGAEVDALEKLRRNNRELKKQVTDLNTTVEALSSEVKEMKAQLELVAGALLND